jgi:histidine triad (HIT) family protein
MKHPESCVFCKVIAGKIPSTKVYEDENVVCIRDIHPQAKVHLLVIPKHPVASLEEAFPENGESQGQMVGRLFEVGTKIARQQDLLPDGFRCVINTGASGGQTVFHLHLHILGGELLRGSFG